MAQSLLVLEAAADLLAEKAHHLDPDRTLPTLRLLWRMIRDHRVNAMLLRGQAAAIGDEAAPKADRPG
ncbi:hypothetical protein ACRAWG_14865 [Methylobacterium sp. P31]